jgi:hypothetical protein
VLREFAEKHGITYPLLSDEGSRVIRELGLLDEQIHEHHAIYGIARRDSVWGVPYPGTFILDGAGIVREKRFFSSYRERETAAAVLDQSFGADSSIHGPETSVSPHPADGAGVSVRAYLDGPAYRSAQRLRLTVELTIAAGWHVYGRPIPEGFVPLSVEVAELPGLAVGELEAPAPKALRIEGLDERFRVYEGRVRLSRPLTFWEKLGDTGIAVTVRYQAYSDVDCLPPQTVQLRLPVKVQNHVDSTR